MYLNCKTYFSYRYGTISTQELVSLAKEKNISSLALTNINSTADCWDFVDFCRQENINPIVGCEIRNGDSFCYILLAKNDAGLREINYFLTDHFKHEREFPERPHIENVWIIYEFFSFAVTVLNENELIGIRPRQVSKLYSYKAEQYPEKFVVLSPITFQNKTYFNLHRLLRAIGKSTLLSKLLPEDIAKEDECFRTEGELENLFKEYPFILENTRVIMKSCEITTELHTGKNKKHFSASKEDDRILLEKFAMEGMEQRFGKNPEARKRVDKELKIIDQLDFNAYFLIALDVIRYARNRGFFYVGRGSGANSIVAYCLHITDVDPIKLDLYFERFLNPYRTSPPDFDMDFSWQDRDEVIDYVFKRYGKDHVALLGMYSTFQGRAVIRELGKVFGLPKAEIDQLVFRRKSQYPTEDKIQRAILKYGSLMQNFPNHQSIHPGGMLISEEPIHHYTALEMPPKGFPTAQIDMFLAEKIGLFKLDILSQRGLGHIKDAIGLIKKNRGVEVDIRQVDKFFVDPNVASQIRRADTIGCFYIESPAMRQLLMKLRCDDFLTLVAASSIIRPGVSKSGMMRQYIERFHNPTGFQYLHPKMEELLKETYGVMVYQEDVIKVAHHFAGLDMGEADVLRRAMSGKYRSYSHFKLIKEKFFSNCTEKGYPEAITAEIWRQMESFGGYSFSKAHSASFAVESYQSLYLKTYFPMEFMVAVINNFGGFYSTETYFQELKKSGATILPPCVNNAGNLTSIHDKSVYTGFIHVQQLEKKTVQKILVERTAQVFFSDLEDFIKRTQIESEQLNILIRIGSLGFTGKKKKELLWLANFQQKRIKKQPATVAIFKEPPIKFELPDFPIKAFEDAYDEIELLGFPLRDTFQMADDNREGLVYSRDLRLFKNKSVSLLGKLVTVKDVRTVNGQIMSFGTFLDENGDWMDTVHFPYIRTRFPFQGNGFYRIKGKVVEEFGVYSIEVSSLVPIGLKNV